MCKAGSVDGSMEFQTVSNIKGSHLSPGSHFNLRRVRN